MKLLLTSKGLSNKSIVEEFERLIGKPVTESIITYIITAGLYSGNDKKWLVDELSYIRNTEPEQLKILELNTLPREYLIKYFDESDALIFSGGNVAGLLHSLYENDLVDYVKDFAEKKVFVGMSASTHMVSNDLAMSGNEQLDNYETMTGFRTDVGLGLIDFYVRCHFQNEKYPHINEELAKELGSTIYGIDNDTAISVIGREVNIISEGEYSIFKP